MNSSGIIAGQSGKAIWLRIVGKGCYQNSPDAQRFVLENNAERKRNFVIDFSECTGLDSTFMGMLLGLAKRLRAQQGCLHLINVCPHNARLLKGLGVHYFCTVAENDGGFGAAGPDACQCGSSDHDSEVSAPAPQEFNPVPHEALDKAEQTRHCLSAHEDLATANEENEGRFRDVIELMRRKAAQFQG